MENKHWDKIKISGNRVIPTRKPCKKSNSQACSLRMPDGTAKITVGDHRGTLAGSPRRPQRGPIADAPERCP